MRMTLLLLFELAAAVDDLDPNLTIFDDSQLVRGSSTS
jgi:hypothetical protein